MPLIELVHIVILGIITFLSGFKQNTGESLGFLTFFAGLDLQPI